MKLRKKKLLLLSCNQFGTFTTVYKICEYASSIFDITVICWDYNKPKMALPNINVVYVSRKGNVIQRNIKLFKKYLEFIKKDYDFVYIKYQKGVSLVKILSKRSDLLLDIRTLSVCRSNFRRNFEDFLLRLEDKCFKYRSILSHELAKKLRLRKYIFFPLGADPFEIQERTCEFLSFLYVGTFEGRNLSSCLKGFELFLMEKKLTGSVSFDIVGDGPEYDKIKQQVINSQWLSNTVHLYGRIPHNKLLPFFKKSQVGVSYIPITGWYDHQPPTKTYEYLLAGQVVLGTNTAAHQHLKNDPNVQLINDDVKSVKEGFTDIWEKYRTGTLTFSLEDYSGFTWANIINQRFLPFIESVVESKEKMIFQDDEESLSKII